MAWTKEELGAWLTELRAAAGLTQQDVGDAAGRDYSQIGEYEKGRRDPRGTVLLDMLGAMGVTFSPPPKNVRTTGARLDQIEEKLDRLLDHAGVTEADGIPDAPPPPRHPRDAEEDRQRVPARPEGLGG